MKKFMFAVALVVASAFTGASVHAATHLQIAGEGEIVISKDGMALDLINTREGFTNNYQHVFEKHENGAEVGIFSNLQEPNDLVVLTVHDNDHKFVTVARYDGEELAGRWKVDATRYMTLTDE